MTDTVLFRRSRRAALVGLLLVPGALCAQELRGIVQSARDGRPVAGATLTLSATSSPNLATTQVSDSLGRFSFTLSGEMAVAHLLVTRRIGFEPDTLRITRIPSGTLEVFLKEVVQDVDAFRVTERATQNQVALDDAVRRGWRVYGPEKVHPYRERAGDLTMLLRLMAVPGIIPARSHNDCIRNTRNNQCLAVIVDGANAGPFIQLTPNDIDFLALLGAAESRTFYGERAPYGAIVIYTRNPGPERQPRRRSP